MTFRCVFICGVFLIASLPVSALAGETECALVDAAMKQPDDLPVAVERVEPAVPVSTNSVDAVKKGLPFRISAMTTVGDRVYLGLVDEETGRTLFLRRGECTWSGFKFLSVEPERGRALFSKDGDVYAGSIRGSSIVRRELKKCETEEENEDSADGLAPESPAEPVTLILNSNTNERVTVKYGGRNSAGVEVEVDGRRYAMPRSIAAGLLKNDFMPDFMKAQALKSFPGLVEMKDGEDADAAMERGGSGFPVIPLPPKMEFDKNPPKHE